MKVEGDDSRTFLMRVERGTFTVGNEGVDEKVDDNGGPDDDGGDDGDVEKRTGNEQRSSTFTVREVDVCVEQGDVLAIVGPVASGKSTLLSGILGNVKSIGANASVALGTSDTAVLCTSDSLYSQCYCQGQRTLWEMLR